MHDISLKRVESESRVPVRSARLVPGINPDEPWILIVDGEAPCLNMEVTLRPNPAIPEIEYWPIEVVGRVPGDICLDAIKEYIVAMPDPPMGTEGLEVVGENQSIKIPRNG